MTIAVLTPPSTLPVSLGQIKQHLRLGTDEEDSYLLDLAEAATSHIECEIKQILIERTMRQYFEAPYKEQDFSLDPYPIKAITSVNGYDEDGNQIVLDSSKYHLITGPQKSFVRFKDIGALRGFQNGIEIDFVCGHGSTGIDIPSNISRALLVLIGHWFEHRGAQSAELETAIIPRGLDALLNPVRRRQL